MVITVLNIVAEMCVNLYIIDEALPTAVIKVAFRIVLQTENVFSYSVFFEAFIHQPTPFFRQNVAKIYYC